LDATNHARGIINRPIYGFIHSRAWMKRHAFQTPIYRYARAKSKPAVGLLFLWSCGKID